MTSMSRFSFLQVYHSLAVHGSGISFSGSTWFRYLILWQYMVPVSHSLAVHSSSISFSVSTWFRYLILWQYMVPVSHFLAVHGSSISFSGSTWFRYWILTLDTYETYTIFNVSLLISFGISFSGGT